MIKSRTIILLPGQDNVHRLALQRLCFQVIVFFMPEYPLLPRTIKSISSFQHKQLKGGIIWKECEGPPPCGDRISRKKAI